MIYVFFIMSQSGVKIFWGVFFGVTPECYAHVTSACRKLQKMSEIKGSNIFLSNE